MLMLTVLESHPFLMMILGGVLTGLGKFIYTKWFSKSSRVTVEKCKDNQALCVASITVKMDALNNSFLAMGVKEFQISTDHKLKLILMTLTELCVAGEGCEERTKERIRQEMLK
jgi:hypothetical protein